MYDDSLQAMMDRALENAGWVLLEKNRSFYARLGANLSALHELFMDLYGTTENAGELFTCLLETVIAADLARPEWLRASDARKSQQDKWFLSNQLAGMSLYVDRFCGTLPALETKLDYFGELGVSLLHLMPLFQSPPGESDGGYAVSDFRTVDPRFGTLGDLQRLREQMHGRGLYLMLDIVLNHTSHRHEWAQQAKTGNKKYQDYYYMYEDRTLPDAFERSLPEIFPESAPGNFSWVSECNRWVMTVFHDYQWDLNYRNPEVLIAMLDNIFFYANLGVDVLRIDAPAFIWKEAGTSCQNLPQAHFILQLMKLCIQAGAPGMALLGEAIVSPGEIMNYFGTGRYRGRECDFAYHATQMALQWDALATGNTKVMLAAQAVVLQKPGGTSWITYTRCHDDIGLGYDDAMIRQAGYNAYEHRKFLQDYYSGKYHASTATGALFSVHPRTGDARISGTLASLCGLEKALRDHDRDAVNVAINKILLMQSMSFFIGGMPMIFYGDEAGYTNSYDYLNEPGKRYDNRWMHRPVMNWDKNDRRHLPGTPEERIFTGTRKLLQIRRKLAAISDHSDLRWLTPHNIHVGAFTRQGAARTVLCIYNFSERPAYLTWYAFRESGKTPPKWFDHWTGETYRVGEDHEYLIVQPFGFHIMEEGQDHPGS